MPLEVERSRTYPVEPERAYDVLLTTPLTELFTRRYAALPPIRAVRDQAGEWGRGVGQSRTIVLGDGGTMRETLTSLDRPNSFGYRIDGITGLMRMIVTDVAGTWRLAPAGTGVQVTWAWTVDPHGTLGRVAMPGFERMWQGYARQALEQLDGILLR